jgi:AcrR family transcriptional regulator
VAHPNRASNAQKPGKSSAAAAKKPGRSRGRPPVISTERLLEVARQVFLELGIRATTSEVATRAGIAEGTIFHRFKSKEELFRAAMNFDPDSALRLAQGLAARAGQGELRQTLVEFAERFMEFGRAAMPMMMMSWSNPESLCADRTSERATRYHKVIAALGQYLDAEMKAGRLRRVDSEVVARMLIGSLHHYCMIELFVGASSERFTHHELAQQVVDVLLASPETS